LRRAASSFASSSAERSSDARRVGAAAWRLALIVCTGSRLGPSCKKNSPEIPETFYYFYGNLETDISATIYEMRYLINLGRNQFTNTSNPTWMSGTTSYVTEIALYDSNYDLIVISKLQSPELRQGIQQYVVKLDF
jgi:hypothetical protein